MLERDFFNEEKLCVILCNKIVFVVYIYEFVFINFIFLYVVLFIFFLNDVSVENFL